jgi:transposase
MLTHIAEFFAIEKDIRARSAGERPFIRQQRGRPLADAFQKWLGTASIAGMRPRVALQ